MHNIYPGCFSCCPCFVDISSVIMAVLNVIKNDNEDNLAADEFGSFQERIHHGVFVGDYVPRHRSCTTLPVSSRVKGKWPPLPQTSPNPPDRSEVVGYLTFPGPVFPGDVPSFISGHTLKGGCRLLRAQ